MDDIMTGLFDSPAQKWLDSLKSGLKSIVIVGQDKNGLDQAALDIRDTWLLEASHTLDEFDASNYPVLIERLNTLVSQKSSAVAGQPAPQQSPIALWVIHNAQDFNPEQLLLLGQMLIHLPGLNLRMVLLHLGTTGLSTWESATRGQVTTHVLHPEKSDPTPDLDMFAPLPEAASLSEDHHMQKFPDTQQKSNHPKAFKWIRICTFALVFVSLGWGMGRWTAPSPVTQPVHVESPKAPTEPALASPTEKIAPQTTETRPALPLIEAALQNNPAPTQATVASKMDRPVVEETIITETATESRPSNSSTLSADAEWLKRLSSDHFVIAHGTFRKLENAQKLRFKHAELSKSRIVPILVSKKVAYAVVTGPFRNEDRANTNLKKLSWASKAKVLSVARTQKLMVAAQKSSQVKP